MSRSSEQQVAGARDAVVFLPLSCNDWFVSQSAGATRARPELVMFEAVAAPTLASDPAASHLVAPDGALVNGELGVIGRLVIGGIVTLAGPVLLGVASLRAGVLPRTSALLQIASVVGIPLYIGVGVVTSALGIPGGLLAFPGLEYAVLFLGYAVAGWTLWRVPTNAVFPSWTKAARAAGS